MRPHTLVRAIALFFVLIAPLHLAASTAQFQVYLDTDNNPTTGCSAAFGGASLSGAEQVLTTSIEVTSTGSNVTGVTRQLCDGSAFGSPINVDTTGWAIGTDGESGNSHIETRIPLSAFGGSLPAVQRLYFVGTTGSFNTTLFTRANGSPIIYPYSVEHRHSAAPGGEAGPRAIVLDGQVGDWNGIVPLVTGGASGGVTAITIKSVSAFAGSTDLFFLLDTKLNLTAPVAVDDTYSGRQGKATNVPAPGVLVNDFSPTGAALSALLVSQPEHGTVSLAPTGGFSYMNNGANAPVDHFTYKAHDGTADSNTATVTINLNQNGAPIARNDNYSVNRSATLVVPAPGVLANDSDPDGDSLTATIHFLPSHGTVTVNLNGSFTYTNDGSSATTDSFTYRASDGSLFDTATVTITITCPSLVITNPATNTGTVGTAFSQTFTSTGGTGAVTFSTASTLPAGLTFSSTGVLSGIPSQFGTFPIVVSGTDSTGCTNSGATYTLTINCQPITVTNPATTTGVANSPFSQTFTQSGAIGTATFTTASTLPAGLTLSTAGLLSGTPTQTGSFPIVVTVTDGNGCTGTSSTYTLTITCQTITVTNPATNTGTAGAAFSQTFTQTGAIGTATFTTASPLPAGLTLSSAGVLSGVPTVVGTFGIVVTVTDANGCTGTGTTYNLTINCQTITVNNPATTTGTASSPFSQTFTQLGAIGGATFATASPLPNGLTLSTAGVLSGTPTQTGSFPIVVTVTDSNGCTGTGATYTLVINCQTISVTNPANTTGTVSAPFSEQFTQSGAIGTATFTLASGTLPTGLTLSTAGLLSGAPTQPGTFPITVTVTDSNGCTGTSATYTLIINCQTITVTNPATTTAPAGSPLSINFTQTGAVGGATFTTASTLPAGLTLSAAGVLSGTPTSGAGSFPIVVTVTDGNGCTGTNSSYTLTITCQTITVTNPATNTGVANTAFSQTFTQSGAIGGATFTTASTLPAGLALSTAGVLSGTPTQTGSFPIVVTVTDGNGCTGTGATYTLTITCQTITVTNPVNTTGTANSAFSETFTAGNAIGTLTFTTASTLPAGLTLSTGGVLSGTPTQTGSFPIVVTVTDANGCTGTGATYTLTINCQTITVNNPVNTTGTVNAPFSEAFTQSNAIGGVTFTTASTLPTGLTLATNGVLSGTPTQTGSFPIVVTVTDSNGCTGTSATYTLVINCQTITVTNPANTTGTVSAPFSEQFTQTGAFVTATFTTASTLPTGLTLSSAGLLAGTPTQTGTFPIVVTVTDANGCTGASATYTLIINCQTITVTNPTSNSSPAGTPLPAVNFTFTESGSIGGATFTTGSTLPTGVTLTNAGVLTGTPTQGGSFPIVVTVTDGNGCTGTSSGYTLTITCPVITVTNPANANGTAGSPFSETFTQSGGQGTITWSETGTLPTGLTLNPSTGVLSGTPTQTGSFPITVTATDQNGCQGSGAIYTIVISCQTVTVTNPGVNTGTVDAPFTQTFTATGILGTATWSETGALPAGITLDPSTGVLSGTPTVTGVFPITVTATDTNGCFGTSSYTLTVNCQTITVTNPGVNTGTVDAPFSQTFTQSGAHGTATFSTSSTLPAGLTLSSAGVLSGTPTQAGTFPIVVTVTDANGCIGTGATYTLTINCQTITVNNPVNTTGTTGSPFSETFTQLGAHGTATFTTASTLPTGFTLDPSTGILAGTTQQHGTFPIVVVVTDSNGCTGTSATYNLTINCQTITVTNPTNTTATVGSPFSEQFTQSGGIGSGTFSTASTLPTGLTLDNAGLLSGTPLQSGSFPITVTFTDANGCTGTGSTYTLVIACNVITVTNPGVNTGTVDALFSQTFTQTGGNGTITWSETGALPAGITLNTATGVLSGTPTAPGSFPITVTATDANGCTGTGSTYTLVINCQTITVTAPGVTTGTVDAPFSQTFTQSGVGTHTPAVFSLNSGSLPSGLTLSSAGVLSGTPSVPGSFPITVKVTDANGCTGISATYTLVIACQTITVTNATSSTVVFNAPLTPAANFTFTQSGVGTHTPAVFSINSGTLPTGVSLSSAGVLSGTPTQTGTFAITVKVTDANGCTGIGPTYNLAVTPDLGSDAYGTAPNQLVDNTQAYVTGGATATPGTPAVALSGSLLANDFPAGGVTVTAATITTTQGGSVTIQADGTFLYTPSVHAAAITSDSFTYTGTSNTGGTATPTSATGTVNLTLLNRVWYVKDNGGAGNGQSQTPFNTLAAVQAAAKANDIIFIYVGTTTTTPLSGGLSLQNGAKLWGEQFGLTVNTHVLVAAGATQPRIKNTSGAAVTVDTNAATAGNRQNVEIRGLDLESTTTNGVNVTSNAGNLTSVLIAGNNVRGAGTQGINLNQSSTGAFDATITGTSITSVGNGIQGRTNTAGTMTITTSSNTIGSSAANGVDIRTLAGASALRIALDSETVTAAGNGIVIDGSAAGTTTITSFLSNSINGNTVGTGIQVTSAIFDVTPGGTFQTVAGGNTVIGASGNSVGAAGMVLTTVSGDLGFTDLDIFTSSGVGLRATGTTPYTGSAGFQIGFPGVVTPVATVTAVSGPAIDLATVSMNSFNWQSISSTNSPTTGAAFNSVIGNFSDNSGSSISGSSGTGFQVGSSNATITYKGTINTTAGKGVDLTTNTGSTISFTGALTISAGTNTAFNATGGGTVSATNTTSTLTTTTGIALNVANTTIAAGGLKFRSITAGTAASGPASGIVLNTTGATGALTVSGTGSAGSGGTIQKTTGAGISLTSTNGPSFNNMIIQNTGKSGVSGTQVTDFTFTNGTISGSGTIAAPVDDRSNIGFGFQSLTTENNVSGTVTITGNTLTTAYEHGVDIQNFAGTITNATISNNTLTSDTNGANTHGSAIRLLGNGSNGGVSNITKATIQSNTITNFPGGAGITAQFGNPNLAGPAGTWGTPGSPTNVILIQSNFINGQSTANGMGANAILGTLTGKGQAAWKIDSNGSVGNPISNIIGTDIGITVRGASAVATADITNNRISGYPDVGASSIAFAADFHTLNTDAPHLTGTISNNFTSGKDGRGIDVLATSNSNAIVDVTITGNTVAAPNCGGCNRSGIVVSSGGVNPSVAGVHPSVCMNMSGNTSAGSGVNTGIGIARRSNATANYIFNIEGFVGGPAVDPTSYIAGQNPAGGGVTMVSQTTGFGNCSSAP